MDNDYIKFSNLNEFPEVVQGVSTRSFGSMKMLVSDPKVIKNRENFARELGIDLRSVVAAENVHGAKIAVVTKDDIGRGALNYQESIQGVDGLITRDPGVNLMITVADCLPVVCYDPILKIVGIAHAGWRGILAGVGSSLINEFKNMGCIKMNDGELGSEIGTREHKLRFKPIAFLKSFDLDITT